MRTLNWVCGLAMVGLLAGCFSPGGGTGGPDDSSGPMGGAGQGGDCVEGESFEAADGCNTCFCTEDGIACTEIDCSPGPGPSTPTPVPTPKPNPGGGCDYNGTSYDVGDSFPAEDGCNDCTCTEGGAVACTLVGCDPGPTPTGCEAGTCAYGDFCYPKGSSFGECSECSCDGDTAICKDIDCNPPASGCPDAMPEDSTPCGIIEVTCEYDAGNCSCGYGALGSGDAAEPPMPGGGSGLVAAPWWTCEVAK